MFWSSRVIPFAVRWQNSVTDISVYGHVDAPTKGTNIASPYKALLSDRISRCDWLPDLARSGYGLCRARKIYHVLVFYPV